MMENRMRDEDGWVGVGVGDGGCKEGASEVLLLHPSSPIAHSTRGLWGVHMCRSSSQGECNPASTLLPAFQPPLELPALRTAIEGEQQ